mgnify:CR=1 FL=1
MTPPDLAMLFAYSDLFFFRWHALGEDWCASLN